MFFRKQQYITGREIITIMIRAMLRTVRFSNRTELVIGNIRTKENEIRTACVLRRPISCYNSKNVDFKYYIPISFILWI